MKVSKKEKNRQAILEVAGELFRSKGFGAVSMREIAEVCDIATGTLYNYFKSKGQIKADSSRWNGCWDQLGSACWKCS